MHVGGAYNILMGIILKINALLEKLQVLTSPPYCYLKRTTQSFGYGVAKGWRALVNRVASLNN